MLRAISHLSRISAVPAVPAAFSGARRPWNRSSTVSAASSSFASRPSFSSRSSSNFISSRSFSNTASSQSSLFSKITLPQSSGLKPTHHYVSIFDSKGAQKDPVDGNKIKYLVINKIKDPNAQCSEITPKASCPTKEAHDLIKDAKKGYVDYNRLKYLVANGFTDPNAQCRGTTAFRLAFEIKNLSRLAHTLEALNHYPGYRNPLESPFKSISFCSRCSTCG